MFGSEDEILDWKLSRSLVFLMGFVSEDLSTSFMKHWGLPLVTSLCIRPISKLKIDGYKTHAVDNIQSSSPMQYKYQKRSQLLHVVDPQTSNSKQDVH